MSEFNIKQYSLNDIIRANNADQLKIIQPSASGEYWLLHLGYIEEGGQRHHVGIMWDRDIRQFTFVGDEAYVSAAAHLFLDIVAKQTTEWIIARILEDERSNRY